MSRSDLHSVSRSVPRIAPGILRRRLGEDQGGECHGVQERFGLHRMHKGRCKRRLLRGSDEQKNENV